MHYPLLPRLADRQRLRAGTGLRPYPSHSSLPYRQFPLGPSRSRSHGRLRRPKPLSILHLTALTQNRPQEHSACQRGYVFPEKGRFRCRVDKKSASGAFCVSTRHYSMTTQRRIWASGRWKSYCSCWARRCFWVSVSW